jgi:hypothetical protein
MLKMVNEEEGTYLDEEGRCTIANENNEAVSVEQVL